VKRSDRARRREPAGGAQPRPGDRGETPGGGQQPAGRRGEAQGGARPRARRGYAGSLLRDLAILVAAFGVGVGVAELAGAANLGVAFGVGQVVFVVVLIVLLTRG
jgi:hypothetical protein